MTTEKEVGSRTRSFSSSGLFYPFLWIRPSRAFEVSVHPCCPLTKVLSLQRKKSNHDIFPLTLKFQNPDVENDYQEYQFELNRHDFENSWGTLSITSCVSSISMASAYTEAFISFVGNTPGSIERMLIGFPFTLFNLKGLGLRQNRSSS
jgi:hypothetical protein